MWKWDKKRLILQGDGDDVPAAGRPRCPLSADIVAKVFLHWGSKILRAAGAAFV